jgi:hypothetical protein
MTTNNTEFDSAIYYDCNDKEELSCTTPEDAIEEYIDGWVEVGDDLESVIRIYSPITVEAYRFQKISYEDIRNETEFAIGRLVESLHDEYGCPDDNDGMSSEVIKGLVDAVLPTIKKAIDEHFRVWACETAGSRIYTADEVIALMREHRPDWFEDK